MIRLLSGRGWQMEASVQETQSLPLAALLTNLEHLTFFRYSLLGPTLLPTFNITDYRTQRINCVLLPPQPCS